MKGKDFWNHSNKFICDMIYLIPFYGGKAFSSFNYPTEAKSLILSSSLRTLLSTSSRWQHGRMFSSSIQLLSLIYLGWLFTENGLQSLYWPPSKSVFCSKCFLQWYYFSPCYIVSSPQGLWRSHPLQTLAVDWGLILSDLICLSAISLACPAAFISQLLCPYSSTALMLSKHSQLCSLHFPPLLLCCGVHKPMPCNSAWQEAVGTHFD